jgi:hypothetical protein
MESHIRPRFFFAVMFLFMAACRDPGAPPSPGGEAAQVPGKAAGVPEDSEFLGLTEREGADRAGAEGLSPRVISVDGRPRPATKDYRPDRINFEIVDGRITAVTRG